MNNMKNERYILNNTKTEQKESIYTLKNFSPQIITRKYLDDIGIECKYDQLTLKKMEMGSKQFRKMWIAGEMYPSETFKTISISLDSKAIEQKYTGVCPSHVFRLDPAVGCAFGCLYCLDIHEDYGRNIIVYDNYSDFVKKCLRENEGVELSYYLSAVTDVFQKPILQTGVIHKILKEFILYYNENPNSSQKLFISTKAGLVHLNYKYREDTIIELLTQLPKNKVQFNVSVGFMPEYLFGIFEPNSATPVERLEALKYCKKLGIQARTVLCQPIFSPYVCEDSIKKYFELLSSYNVENFKPEFATLSLEALCVLGQVIGFFDKNKEKILYEHYIGITNKDNKKGTSGRLAPEVSITRNMLLNLYNEGLKQSITMTICNWIRLKNNIVNDIPILEDKRRFPCL